MAPVRRPARPVWVHVGASGEATAVHGVGIRPGPRMVGEKRAGLVGAPIRVPLGRAAPDARPEHGVSPVARAVVTGRGTGRLLLDRRQRRAWQCAVLPALRLAGSGGPGAGVG